MKFRRSVLIPAILALSAAGSILAGSAVSLAATSAPAVVTAAHVHANPDVFYDG